LYDDPESFETQQNVPGCFKKGYKPLGRSKRLSSVPERFSGLQIVPASFRTLQNTIKDARNL